MRIFEWIDKIRDIPFDLIGDVIDLIGMAPALSDGPALRIWLSRLNKTFGDFAELTATTFDDWAADKAADLLANDAAWDVVFSLISVVASGEEKAIGVNELVALADETKIDPIMIISLVTIILALVKWIRARRENA